MLVVLSFHQPALVLHLHPWCWSLAATGVGAVFLQPLAQTVLAPVVVSPVATCAGGLFPSTHWRTYSTCVRATCTVWYILYNNVFGRANVTIPSRYVSRTVNTAFTTEDCILVGLINLFSKVQDQDCLNYFLFLGCLATYAPCRGFMTL